LQLTKGEIEFKNVRFTYPKMDGQEKGMEETMFNDLNLKIVPGTTNAIVGRSGFGKTTLFNMLVREVDKSLVPTL
jgi:ABC-type multidrug transport system fused ATPase/permease subunit